MKANAPRVICVLLACSSARASVAAHWRPTTKEIQTLERKVSLPNGADPLDSYQRYYAGENDRAGKVIHGRYVGLTTLPRKGFISVVSPSKLPTIADGGCGVIDVIYSVPRSAVMSVACNGEASPPPR
jgi:hypothetical protein